MKHNVAWESSEIPDLLLEGGVVIGRRGSGLSTALRALVHKQHQGKIQLAVPFLNLGQIWIELYREAYPDDAIPKLVSSGSIDRLRGRSEPIYVECWRMLTETFQNALIRQKFIVAVDS